MKTYISCVIAIVAAAVCGLPNNAHTQDAWSGFAASTAMNQMMASNRERWIERQEQGRQASKSERGAAIPNVKASGSRIASAGLSFRPSLVVRARVINQFVARARAVDPAGATQLAAFTASNDMIELADIAMKPLGLRTDNMADAYAVWWVSAWQAYHKDYSTPSRETLGAVKRQAEAIIIRLPFLADASDQIKQEFAEDILLNAIVIDTAVETAKTDAAYARQLSGVMGQSGRAMGVDFTLMRLTTNGFVPSEQ